MVDILTIRLSQAERGLLHALCFCAVSRMHDDRMDLMVDVMRKALTTLPPRSAMTKVRLAAQAICDAYPRRNQAPGRPDWAQACMKADAAAQEYHWAAFCALSEV